MASDGKKNGGGIVDLNDPSIGSVPGSAVVKLPKAERGPEQETEPEEDAQEGTGFDLSPSAAKASDHKKTAPNIGDTGVLGLDRDELRAALRRKSRKRPVSEKEVEIENPFVDLELDGEVATPTSAIFKLPRSLTQDPEHLEGETLAGRYKIVKRIGRGGMGVLYSAHQENLDRQVVVKVLAGETIKNPEARQRFDREAKGLSQLSHPNIVTIFDYGFGFGDRLGYIVMEFVDGEELDLVLMRRERLYFEEFLPIALQILDAIGEAHAHGVVHRDLKLGNIMLSTKHGKDNFVKILDFGLAKLASSKEITKEQLVGSVSYLSPELIRGTEVDQRTDVYSLGVVFYALLSGRKPFEGDDDYTILYKHVNEAPPPLDSVLPEGQVVPEPVVRLIHRCLEKDPQKRPKDANEVLQLMISGLQRQDVALPWVGGDSGAPPRFRNVTGIDQPSRITGQFEAIRPSQTTGSFEAVRPGMSLRDALAEIADEQRTLDDGRTSLFVIDSAKAGLPDDGRQSLFVLDTSSVSREQARASNTPLYIIIALLAAGLLLAGIYVVGNRPAAPVAPVQPVPTVAPKADETAALRSGLDRVARLLAEKKLGQAEALLTSLEPSLVTKPELVGTAAEYREQITVERLRAEASQLLAESDVDGATQKYRALLLRNPSDPALDGLRAQIQEAKEKQARRRRAKEEVTAEADAGAPLEAVEAPAPAEPPKPRPKRSPAFPKLSLTTPEAPTPAPADVAEPAEPAQPE